MKRTSLALVVVALSAVPLSGCGTVANLASAYPEIYGGVAKDIEYAMTPPESDEDDGGKALLVFWLVELSCSSVADTLTIPLVLYCQAKKAHADNAARESLQQRSSGPAGSSVEAPRSEGAAAEEAVPPRCRFDAPYPHLSENDLRQARTGP